MDGLSFIQTDNETRMKWNREVDRAIVSNVPEDEIRQIKKEYITDRIKSSVKIYGNRPELFSHIIGNAIAALALLISKVLRAVREFKGKLFQEELDKKYPQQKDDVLEIDTSSKDLDKQEVPKSEATVLPKPIPQEQAPSKPQIPAKPNMPADAQAYPKLSRIYGELHKQNDVIFEAEKERNHLEDQRDNLKGIAKLTKKGEFQGKIDRKNGQIEILKRGLTGIVWRYGYQTVQDFYRSYKASTFAYEDYLSKVKEWESIYGASEKPKEETITEKMDRYQKELAKERSTRTHQSKDRGAR